MSLYLQDPDVTIWNGDALEVLREMPDASVHMCATSPPFYGLRDYGVDGQIGLEETPDEWVTRLVDVFREVRRVLRDDGTLWVEIGDSYSASPAGNKGERRIGDGGAIAENTRTDVRALARSGIKQKDLLGQPWMLAFALRADGWYLRSEVIWSRPNPMPESVTDRPTKAHSTVFLLSKRPRYFFDADAIREPYKQDDRKVTTVKGTDASEQHRDGERWPNPMGANARSVWTIPTEPTPFAHFATWPSKLVKRMILAGTSEKGCCPECGASWVRGVERTPMEIDRSERTHSKGQTRASGTMTKPPTAITLGWSPSCDCGDEQGVIGQVGTVAHEPVPCTVLDPFGGSGTTALVARKHGRRSVLIELNEEYCELAAVRLSQQSLFA